MSHDAKTIATHSLRTIADSMIACAQGWGGKEVPASVLYEFAEALKIKHDKEGNLIPLLEKAHNFATHTLCSVPPNNPLETDARQWLEDTKEILFGAIQRAFIADAKLQTAK